MRLLTAIALVCLASVTLAGCSTNDPLRYPSPVTSSASHSSSASASASASVSQSASATSTGHAGNGTGNASAGNHAPVGALTVAINGTLAKFTLNASDADHDNLTWTLAFGDGNATNGTTLPTTLMHNYTATGNLTARFSVSDGTDTSNYTAALNVTAAGVAPAFTHTEGTKAPGNPANSAEIPGVGFCGGSCCAGFNLGVSGIDCVFTMYPATLAGHHYTVTSDKGDPDVEIWATCSETNLGSVDNNRNPGPESGVLPDGAACMVMWDNAGAGDTPTFTFTVV